MALRNQPYLPLYVDDFMVDEKLRECSAESTGVYIRLMCLMHKSEEYGVILLKQKDKQNSSTCLNFAHKLALHLPYNVDVILRSLNELTSNGVIQIEDDKLLQRRMVRDNQISDVRSLAGKRGGNKSVFAQAKRQANSVIENVNEIDTDSLKEKGGAGGKRKTKKTEDVDKVKSMYGSQTNVALTFDELENLRAKYPDDADDAIEFLSKYIAEKGYRSKSHNLAIQRWVVDAVKEKKSKNSTNINKGGVSAIDKLRDM
jgi:uncharacterized protein YdaU (DUF1376 family)